MISTILKTMLATLAVAFLLSPAQAWQACHGQTGTASWYGTESGSRTASGAYFDGSGMTAAMPSRAMLGRRVVVTDMATARSVTVLVNDVGPAPRLHRIIDLSRAAARRLGMAGLARVCIQPPP